MVGAALALAVVVAHVGDQSSITAFADPDWLAWGYRLSEVGGLLTAVTLLVVGGWQLSWTATAWLGIAPFRGYLITRTFAVPGDAGDVGNWADWPGTMSLRCRSCVPRRPNPLRCRSRTSRTASLPEVSQVTPICGDLMGT